VLEYVSENIGFFLKVVITHAVTYTLCGLFFYKVNNYAEWIKKDKPFVWRKMEDPIFRWVIGFQIIRGILFGIVLLLFKDTIVGVNFGFLKLFFILIILGLFNVYQPSPGSIEGFIFIRPDDEKLTLKEKFREIRSISEILIQILIFSIIVTINWIELWNKLFS